jgi:hypothetical protein
MLARNRASIQFDSRRNKGMVLLAAGAGGTRQDPLNFVVSKGWSDALSSDPVGNIAPEEL